MVNILIFRTDKIGDLIVTIPAILTIKKYFGEIDITLVASEKNYKYADTLGIFNQIHQFPRKNIFSKIFFIHKLYKKKFDYIFIFDGKERSILTAFFIKAKLKVALSSTIKFYYKIMRMKFFEDNENTNLNEVFQKMLFNSNISAQISNYDFLKNKKDNNFSKLIPIFHYVHIHIDEKWFNNLYIKTYTNINPSSDQFTDFINTISKNDDILITTGLIELDLVKELINNYFEKIDDNIYYNKRMNKSVYLIDKPTFEDIESLLRNSKTLISCHGAITHAANSFNVKIIDIIEENKKNFYQRFTSYLNKYSKVYRKDFFSIKNSLYKKLYE